MVDTASSVVGEVLSILLCVCFVCVWVLVLSMVALYVGMRSEIDVVLEVLWVSAGGWW